MTAYPPSSETLHTINRYNPLKAPYVNQDKSDPMNQKEPSQLTDKELLEAAKNNKPSPIIDAFFIGFLVGIIIYSLVASTWGFLTLIPLFLIYGLLKKPKHNKALKKELKERNLTAK
jgi:hypothetical protein